MKTLFIHIPKTAGLAVYNDPQLKPFVTRVHRNILKPTYVAALERVFQGKQCNYMHSRWRDISSDALRGRRVVAVVRNPWSRVVSRFTYGTNLGLIKTTFDEWLKTYHKNKDQPFYWHRATQGWTPQVDYVTNVRGQLMCDILRFEHLNKDVGKYFSTSHDIRPRNVSNGEKTKDKVIKRSDYRKMYNSTTAQLIADWYAADIDMFEFTFEDCATKNIWKYKK